MVRLATLLTLKSKAANTRNKVKQQREAQGKTNERTGGEASEDKLDSTNQGGSGLYSSVKNILNRTPNPRRSTKSPGGSTSDNPGPRLTIPKPPESLEGPPDAAAAGAAAAGVAPLSTDPASTSAGTPRYETMETCAGPAAASAQPGTPRYGAGESASAPLPAVTPAEPAVEPATFEVAAPKSAAAEVDSTTADLDMVGLTMDDEDEPLVKAAVADIKAKFEHELAMAACCWMLKEQLGPEGTNTRSMEDALADALAKQNVQPNFNSISDPARRQTCETSWNAQVGALMQANRQPSAVQTAKEKSAPWLARVMKAKAEVIDPNAERLTEHMQHMRNEHVLAAAAELAGSRLRDVIKAKALSIHRILMVAMDDVQSQFCGGMRQLASPGLSSVLSPDDISTLCTTAVVCVREQFDMSYTIPVLEKELSERIQPTLPPNALSSARSGASVTAETDPLGWLRALILGAVQIGPLGDQERYFLQVNLSEYLDPFLDGDVPPERCLQRSEGFYYDRLKQDWACTFGPGHEMQIPASLAYAQYITHCITKLNANHGFGVHIPGLGRSPISDAEQQANLKQIVTATIDATERDFDPSQRVIGEFKHLTLDVLLPIAREHLTGLFMYHNELGDALATANREGEEARRQERLRIWGYA